LEFNNQTYDIKIWDHVEDGKLGRFVAVDTETTVVPFYMTPDIVTFQAYSGGTNVYYVLKEDISRFLKIHGESFLILHNAPFDMDVISKSTKDTEAIYDIYDNNRVRDTSILYRLWHLANVGFIPFKYNLALLSEKLCGIKLVKDEVRENFGQFVDLPFEAIPQEYLEYGAKDVIATYKVYFKLIALLREHDKKQTLLSHDIQAKGDLALLHMHKNGIGFDLEQRDKWVENLDKEISKHSNILASWGWVRGKKGVNDVYESIIDRLGIANALPRTASGVVSSKADDLEQYRKYPFINSYLQYQSLEKAASFVTGITSSCIHPRYNLMVNTGRTSCSKPNFQQLPKLGGIREMFIPTSKEDTFIITDYSAIELSTLAQVCYDYYGYSEMRERINAGDDLHKYYASVMNGCELDEVTKQQRQEAKAANFGFPGGLGIDTFIEFSAGYGLELTQEKAQEMKDVWFAAFPEMEDYMKNEIGEVFTLTGRKRGNTSYCAEKNTPFQGLAADGAKIALYNLDKAGFKIVGFVHDEIITQVAKSGAEQALKKQEEIMIDSMREVVPDVRVGVESAISDFYTK
jgi:DNA polymerase I-like protein with 3'-5' exonuclease and polymerase domains